MISFRINEVKSFMAKLLASTTFDHFILKDLDIQTFTGFQISGQLNEAFFTKEELEEKGENRFVFWSDVRNIAFAIIKGNKTPLSLKIVLQLPPKHTEDMLQSISGNLSREDVGGFYMNIRYEKGELHLISGIALKTFSLDKSMEQEWDKRVKEFLKQQGIEFE